MSSKTIKTFADYRASIGKPMAKHIDVTGIVRGQLRAVANQQQPTPTATYLRSEARRLREDAARILATANGLDQCADALEGK